MSVIQAKKQLLSSVARADGTLREIEVATVAAILNTDATAPETPTRTLSREMRFGNMQSVSKAIRQLARLPMGEREKLVQLLWVTALCDGDLHPKEEALIYSYADALGVARSVVAKQQPHI